MNTKPSGFSGASVEVGEYFTVKRGPGVLEQGRYAQQLGVGPRIVAFLDDGYVMETARQTHVSPIAAITQMLEVLFSNVWFTYKMEDGNAWRTDFAVWAARQPYDPMPLMTHCYPSKRRLHQCLIHGDPTLSNVLYDKEGNLLLIDPLEPKGKIPGLITVDLGKIMQSVIGWEHVAYGWPLPSRGVVNHYASSLLKEERLPTMFWLGVHALRIVPYAQRNNPLIVKWAMDVAEIIFTKMKWSSPCDTLSTLTERSSTHGKRSLNRTERSA